MANFTLKENPTYLDFGYNGKTFKIEITDYKFVIEEIGEKIFSGHSTIYSSGEKHVCGASGFGLGAGDICYACHESSHRSGIINAASKFIEETFVVAITKNKLLESIRKAEERKTEQEKIEEKERRIKLKTEALKSLPDFLREVCLPKIQQAVAGEHKNGVDITVGPHEQKNEYLAEAARCSLVNEGLKAKVMFEKEGRASTVILEVSW